MPVEYRAPKSRAKKGMVSVPIFRIPVFDIPINMAQRKYSAQAEGDGMRESASLIMPLNIFHLYKILAGRRTAFSYQQSAAAADRLFIRWFGVPNF